jgi:hypothetical protein
VVLEGPVVYQAQLEYDQGDPGEEHPEDNDEVCGDHVADAVERGDHVAEACLVLVLAVVLVTTVIVVAVVVAHAVHSFLCGGWSPVGAADQMTLAMKCRRITSAIVTANT